MPTADFRFESVVFPVTVYEEFMAKIGREVRGKLSASLEERRAEGVVRWSHIPADEKPSDDEQMLTPASWDLYADTVYTSQFAQPYLGWISVENVSWKFDSLAETLPELRKPYDSASFMFIPSPYPYQFVTPQVNVRVAGGSTEMTVTAATRIEVQSVGDFFGDKAPSHRAPEPKPEKPKIFIGHGGAQSWQTTERWLTQLGFDVKAYETLPHSGRTIERVLEDALGWANFALLVMTAEDQMSNDTVQARQNVVHELGLFQGRLGWDRAIVMLEAGAAEFSNIAGTNQLRFPSGDISAKHGDILIALKEQFPHLTF
jgi:predicted nucleotide-binding protein